VTDPLRALFRGVEPVDPRPAFAAELRARIEAALDPVELPERSPTMPDTIQATQLITPYLSVSDANAALAYYTEYFGAFEQMRVVGDDGRVGHAEFTIGGARFMLADEYPEIGVVSPTTLGGTPTALHLVVADVDHAYRRAVEGGADGLRPPADQAHGNRNATVVDPFGHRWMLSQPIEALTTEEYAAREHDFTVTASRAPVEVGYLTLATPDLVRASRFYGELFGWEVVAGNGGEGHGHVANTRLPMGFAPPADGATTAPGEAGPVVVHFRVDDIERYAARVTELGGTVLSRATSASGGNASCVDDQGLRFDLFQPAPGY
jgi:uncharacterized glyoxalase superfamily protein PhnB